MKKTKEIGMVIVFITFIISVFIIASYQSIFLPDNVTVDISLYFRNAVIILLLFWSFFLGFFMIYLSQKERL